MLSGVGLGLRWEFLAEVLEAPSDIVRFFEIAPENYLRRGGYFPAALEKVRSRWPVLTHGLSMSLGGHEPIDASYLRDLRAFVRELDSPWHSDHLSFSGAEGAFLHDLLPVPFDVVTAQRMADRIRMAQDHLGKPLVVENISYYLSYGHNTLSEAEFIAEVLERSGAGLLLDVNNLDVNSVNHGTDPWAFLETIPLDRVVEIHVAGPEPDESGFLVDTHGAEVAPRVYELLSYVVERRGKVPVLLERDNNVPGLSELLTEVRRIEATYEAALAKYEVRTRQVHAA